MKSIERLAEINSNQTEDSRERLIVLTEMKDEWASTVEEWRKMNSVFIQNNVPTQEEELLLYQIIVGTFPLQTDAGYEKRLQEYVVKTILEESNSVKNNNIEQHAKQITLFLESIFSPHHPYFKSLSKFLDEIVDYGIINSLTQLTIRMTSPGLKEIQTGNMFFDFGPPNQDNKGRINNEQLRITLEKFSKRNDRIQFISELWNKRRNSEIKQWLVATLLSERNQQNDLFLQGEYIPLKVRGTRSENILAFGRKYNDDYFITIVPLLLYSISEKETSVDWGNTTLELPIESGWRNIIDERTYPVTTGIKINLLLKDFPIACIMKI